MVIRSPVQICECTTHDGVGVGVGEGNSHHGERRRRVKTVQISSDTPYILA